MVLASRLYYLDDLTQAEIARRLGTSRESVSRLLSEARRQGIVQIEISPPAPVDAEELARLRDKVREDYDRQMDVRYGAARGWVDGIIDPAQTREALILALEVATRHVAEEPFRVGVYQV